MLDHGHDAPKGELASNILVSPTSASPRMRAFVCLEVDSGQALIVADMNYQCRQLGAIWYAELTLPQSGSIKRCCCFALAILKSD